MTRTLLPALLVAVALVGCKTEEEEPPVGARFDLTEVVGWEISPAVGAAPLAVPVRAINERGTPVSSEDKAITIGTDQQVVTFDGAGYGFVYANGDGSITASVDGGAPVEIHATTEAWDGFGLMPASAGLPDIVQARPGTGGMVVRTESQVYWAGFDGETHRVFATADGDVITEMKTAHIDSDGVLDALIQVGGELILLRGHYGGGMSWGAGFLGRDGLMPEAAGVGDTDGDGIPDVVIGWSDGTTSWLEVQHGVGLWTFEPAPLIPLSAVPTDLSVGDNSGEGRQQITVVVDSGDWLRFVISVNDRYSGTGPQLVLNFAEGTTVAAGMDRNGDGGDEIFMLGPRNPGQDREVIVYDLVGVNTQYLRLTPQSAFVDIRDGNDDQMAELWLLHENQELFTLTWNGADNTQRRVATFPSHAPFAVNVMDGDTIPDVGLAGSDWFTWWLGGVDATEATTWWAVDEPAFGVNDLDIDPPIVVADLDGSAATVEFVSYSVQGQRLYIQGWQMTPSDEPMPVAYGEFELSNSGAEPIDLAVCGGSAYVLTTDGLDRIQWSGGIPTRPSQRALMGEAVDCGTGPSGATAAVLDGDTVHWVDATLGTVANETHAGANDIAIVRRSSQSTIASCDATDCSAIAWNYGPREAAVTTSADAIHVDDGTTQWTLVGTGWLEVSDVDGDGTDDLIAQDGQLITVYRSTGDGFGVAEHFHTQREIVGNVVAVDVTGDGQGDILHIDDSADLVVTFTPGYEPAPPPP